jgi:hypothetical protein
MMQSDDKVWGNEATASQTAVQGGAQRCAKGTEAQLLWTDLEILGMLPKVKLQMLAKDVGIDMRSTKAQMLDCIKTWCKEQEDASRQGPLHQAARGWWCHMGPARWVAKCNKRLVLGSEEDEEEVKDEDEGEDEDKGGGGEDHDLKEGCWLGGEEGERWPTPLRQASVPASTGGLLC